MSAADRVRRKTSGDATSRACATFSSFISRCPMIRCSTRRLTLRRDEWLIGRVLSSKCFSQKSMQKSDGKPIDPRLVDSAEFMRLANEAMGRAYRVAKKEAARYGLKLVLERPRASSRKGLKPGEGNPAITRHALADSQLVRVAAARPWSRAVLHVLGCAGSGRALSSASNPPRTSPEKGRRAGDAGLGVPGFNCSCSRRSRCATCHRCAAWASRGKQASAHQRHRIPAARSLARGSCAGPSASRADQRGDDWTTAAVCVTIGVGYAGAGPGLAPCSCSV